MPLLIPVGLDPRRVLARRDRDPLGTPLRRDIEEGERRLIRNQTSPRRWNTVGVREPLDRWWRSQRQQQPSIGARTMPEASLHERRGEVIAGHARKARDRPGTPSVRQAA